MLKSKFTTSEAEAAGENTLGHYDLIFKALDGNWVWTTENIELDAKKVLTFSNKIKW